MAIRDAQKPTFSVIEFNVLANHLHLITEALGAELLARGVAGLEVRLARRLNRALKRRGKLFKDRYHVRYLQTPTQVRHAIRYVLFNRKHHDTATRFDKCWIDPFSSAPWFTNWASDVPRWKRKLVDEQAPTVAPSTWLLSAGWLRLGALRFDETPA